MDLLKDITQGLRGSGETHGNERGRTSGGSARDRDRRRSTGSREDGGSSDDDSPSDDGAVESSDESREDEHVCSFCEAEFDATRGVCPDCDAEIVFRGER